MTKLVSTIREAVALAGLKDGMTVSFHHHLRNGDYVLNMVMAEIDYAYEVIEAIRIAKEQGKGAIALRGKMIDAPIVARAERTISMAVEMGLGREV